MDDGRETAAPESGALARVEPASGTDVARWVAEHADDLFRYALSRVGDRETARDVVQETFLALVKGAGFEGRSSPRTWLIGVLRHKIADHFRRAAQTPEASAADPEEDLFDGGGRWRVPPGPWPFDPGDALDRKRFRQALQLCLRRLSPRRASLFVLRELEGLSTEELCKEFATTPTNIWVLLHRARLALRACLERSGFGGGKETP
ncbi:MAG: sigma-70 family RNA polymerase sigma factor [Deferrisomatales bacterium]|nr:sigma-70 family RNA polymerase sigma factor [Deferrisomatales bacterium]